MGSSHSQVGLRTCNSSDVTTWANPEEAARGEIPAKYVRVVGTVIRGDRAIVAQLMNDGPPFEVETAYCSRAADGTWDEGQSGNSTTGFLPTGDGVGTWVAWDEAPEAAVAARFVCGDRDEVVPVIDGCAFAVFDDVEVEDEISAVFDAPQIAAWISDTGGERVLPRHEAPAWMRERMRQEIEEHKREADAQQPDS